MRVIVTEKALHEMISEALWNKDFSGWSANHDQPATVNSSVDPSISVTDPVNPNFKPQDKTEFAVAMNQLVRNLPDEDMPELYDVVKATIEAGAVESEEEEMKIKAAQGGTQQVEAALRRSIRRMLIEADLPPVKKIPFGVHGKEYQDRIDKSKAWLRRAMPKAIKGYENPKEDDYEVNPDVPEAGDGVPDPPGSGAAPWRRTHKSTALGSMEDVGGASFADIAQEMELSVSGAKGAVDKALEKVRFMDDMDEDDRDILVLQAVKDYIEFLSKSDEVTAADVELMKSHPEIVTELDGFRDFLHPRIQKVRKSGELEDLTDDDIVDIDVSSGGDGEDEISDDDILNINIGGDRRSRRTSRTSAPPAAVPEEEINPDDILDINIGEGRRPILRMR